MKEHEWQDDALCAQTDPDLFFPDFGAWQTSQQAVKICGSCPVTVECARLGMQFDFGIFGGLTVNNRKAIKRRAAA